MPVAPPALPVIDLVDFLACIAQQLEERPEGEPEALRALHLLTRQLLIRGRAFTAQALEAGRFLGERWLAGAKSAEGPSAAEMAELMYNCAHAAHALSQSRTALTFEALLHRIAQEEHPAPER